MFSDTANTEMVSSVCHPECNKGSLKDERFEVEINSVVISAITEENSAYMFPQI
jgi:hypothetical protein